jgi:hypothetical protein
MDGDCTDQADTGDGHQQADDSGVNDTDTDATDSGNDTGVEAHTFALAPSEAAAGTTFIASLTVEGPFDLATIESVEFTSGVQVLASENRGTELLMTIQIPDNVPEGPTDLLLRLSGDQIELFENALTVLAVDGSGGTGGTDTGSGTSGTGGDSGGCG